jgi:hypothetical protein
MAEISNEQRLEYLNEFASLVVRDAKRELDAKQPRRSVKAVWKDGKPVSWKERTIRRVPNTTGALKDSIRYEIKEIQGNTVVFFYALEYWYYVNFGRKGILIQPTRPDAKAPPKGVIKAWTESKNIRPRDEDGSFIPNTSSNRASMNYMINRKIKWFGISGTQFWTKTFSIYADEMREKLGKRIAKDLLNEISKWPST